MVPARTMGIPKEVHGWRVLDTRVGDYFRGGCVRLHWGSHDLRWVTVDWKDGRWVCHGPFTAAQFESEVDTRNGGSLMSFLQRRTAGGGATPVAGGVVTGSLAGVPAVLEYLSSSVYADGASRVRSTLLVLVEDGSVKVCLSDRDQEQSLWRSASSLEDALLALEATLEGDHQDWRRSGSGGGAKPPAKRK